MPQSSLPAEENKVASLSVVAKKKIQFGDSTVWNKSQMEINEQLSLTKPANLISKKILPGSPDLHQSNSTEVPVLQHIYIRSFHECNYANAKEKKKNLYRNL